jgi:hypothetical protein
MVMMMKDFSPAGTDRQAPTPAKANNLAVDLDGAAGSETTHIWGDYVNLGTDTRRFTVSDDTDASRHEYFPTLFRRVFRQLLSMTARLGRFAGSAA